VLVKWLGNEEGGSGDGAASGQYSGISNNDPQSHFAVELAVQRLDMLNHYRVSFASGREIDSDYFKQFTALVQTIGSQPLLASNISGIQEQAAALITAGQQEDAQTIRETLPAFCNAIKNYQLAMKNEQNDEGTNDLLSQLKRALLGDAPSAEDATAAMIMAELRAARLDPRGRELFFLLNDLLLEGKNAKAAEAIDNYLGG
jgi:hypothetical protein